MAVERTLSIIKPDAVAKHGIGAAQNSDDVDGGEPAVGGGAAGAATGEETSQ